MLICVITKQKRPWDLFLGQVEFAYNSTVNKSTSKSPFNIVYSKEPNHTVDLAIMPKSNNIVVASKVIDSNKVIQDVWMRLQ